MTDYKYLKLIWDESLSHYSNQTDVHNTLWDEVVSAYSNSDRYYHNMDHIHTMITLAQEYKHKITSSIHIFNLAIFYHDIVYNVAKTDNELESWRFANKHLHHIPIPNAELKILEAYILATKTHQHHSDTNINLLLDIDLFTLSKPWNAYVEYTNQIRNEYSIYPDEVYISGRIQVLTHFLKSGPIYKTSEFYECHEKQALKNLNNELKELNHKLKPLMG